MMKKLMLSVMAISAFSAMALDVRVTAKDFDPCSGWTVDGEKMIAEKKAGPADAIVQTPAAGDCIVWAKVLSGSKLKVDVLGTPFVPKAAAKEGEYAWEKLGLVGGVPAGWMSISLSAEDGAKSAVAEIMLTDNPDWKAPELLKQ